MISYLQQRGQEHRVEKRQSLQQWCWKTGQPQIILLEHSFISYIKIKWFKNLSVRHEAIKLLEEDISRTHPNRNGNAIILEQSLKAKEIKAKVNKWDPKKLLQGKGNY